MITILNTMKLIKKRKVIYKRFMSILYPKGILVIIQLLFINWMIRSLGHRLTLPFIGIKFVTRKIIKYHLQSWFLVSFLLVLVLLDWNWISVL